jgi:putative FmdB family regulatory protein
VPENYRSRTYTAPVMPTYEYACKSCGHTFEIVRSMSDPPLTECPRCGGELRRIFAAPTITFRGSGFYATDHGKKSKGTKKEEVAAGASDTKGGESSSSTGEKHASGTSDSKGGTSASPGSKGTDSAATSGAKKGTTPP